MTTKKPSKKPSEEGTGHDDREIDVRAIARSGAMLAAFTLGTLGVVWVFMGTLTNAEKATHGKPAPIAAGRPTSPAEPRLQPSPPLGLKEFRAQEEKILGSYRWADPAAGLVSVPIEVAIDRVAEKGLPARTQVPPAPTTKLPLQSGGLQ